MKKKYNIIRMLIMVIVFAIIFFFFGYLVGTKKEQYKYIINQDKPIVRVDTITITETIEKSVPKSVIKYKTDTIVTEKSDTVFLEYERKEYITEINNDSVKGQIKTILRGYDSVLDTLQYNLSFQQKTLLKQKKMGFTVGPSVGLQYNFINKQINPYIGIGIMWGYNF